MIYLKKNFLSFIKKISLDYIITFLGLVGQLAIYVQGIKIFQLESACAVSLFAYIIGFVSMSGWLTYGTFRRIKPLIITNIFGLIGAAWVIGEILYYK